MSQKAAGFTRFEFVIGTANLGGVLIMPTLANDRPVAIYTQTAFADTRLTPTYSGVNVLTAAYGCTQAYLGNLPYAMSDLEPNTSVEAATNYDTAVYGRIVSVGVSAQYTGTLSSLSGCTYCYASPTHMNMYSVDPSGISSFVESDVKAVDQSKCWLQSGPCNSIELEYQSPLTAAAASGNVPTSYQFKTQLAYPWSNAEELCATSASTSTVVGSAPMVILFSGTPGQTVHVEIIQHVEYTGQPIGSKATPSHSDAVGTSMVLEASTRVPQMKAAAPKVPLTKIMGRALKEVAAELAPAAISAAGRAALALLL
jgi:hypothetical protein